MRLRLGRLTLEVSLAERRSDRTAMADFVLRRRFDELAVLMFMGALLGLGLLSALMGALAAPDASGFWANFLGGIALLAAMTLPVWLVQRWQSLARPALSPERVRAFRLTRLALIVLWYVGLAIAAIGLVINFQTQAPFLANLAVALLIAYMAGWALLVLLPLRKAMFAVGRSWMRRLTARSR